MQLVEKLSAHLSTCVTENSAESLRCDFNYALRGCAMFVVEKEKSEATKIRSFLCHLALLLDFK